MQHPPPPSDVSAQEATTGNLSMGNTNYDNHSYHNVNAHKLNKSMHIDDTSISNIGLGGMRSTTHGDGTTVIDRSNMNSNLGNYSLDTSQRATEQLTDSAYKSEQLGNNHAATANQHFSTANEKVFQMAHAINQQQASGIDYSSRLSSDQSNAVEKMSQAVQKFSQAEGITETISTRMLASASIGGGFKFFKGNLEASGSGEYASKENYDKAKDFIEQNSLKDYLTIGRTLAESKNLNLSEKLSQLLSSSYLKRILDK